MAHADDEPKTEEASPRRRARARRFGQVARSPGLSAAGGLLALALVLWAGSLGAQLWGALQGMMRASLALAAQPASAAGHAALGSLLVPLMRPVALPALLTLLAIAAGAAVVGMVQVGAFFSLAAVSPARPRGSVGARLRGMFSGERAATGVLSLVQWLLLLAVATAVLLPSLPGLWSAPLGRVGAARDGLALLLPRLLLALALAGLFVGTIDLLLRRVQLAAAQRMGRRERMRERREDEGDPALLAERRRLHAELATLADVERVSLLVFDWQGWAVALAYGEAERASGAPRVVARGRGDFAHRLRVRCEQLGIQVAAPAGLARALHRHGPGEAIGRAHYEAVARLLRGRQT